MEIVTTIAPIALGIIMLSLGLGLTNSKILIEKLGGSITQIKNNIDKGEIVRMAHSDYFFKMYNKKNDCW